MKRSVVQFLSLFILLSVSFVSLASSEALIEFTDYSYQELLDIKEKLYAEIQSRPEAGKITLKKGNYLVGKDIPQGEYTVEPVHSDLKDNIYNYFVYENEQMYRYAVDREWIGDFPKSMGFLKEGDVERVALVNGDLFIVEWDGIQIERIGNIDEASFSDYIVPNGTTIPVGTYVVGEAIPAGAYSVNYNGNYRARFRVYATFEESKKGASADKDMEAVLASDNTMVMAFLKEGQAVKVEYNNVIMTKSPGFVFD